MERLRRAIDRGNLAQVDQVLQSGTVDQIDEKMEEELKYIVINLVTSIQYSSASKKAFSRQALAMILRRSPENSVVYNIPAIMAANFKQTDVVLALMLKGGSPSEINPDFLQPFLNRNNEGVSPLLREIAQVESAAHQAGKSFRAYTEEQGKPYSLEEVLARLENQIGGRRRKHVTQRKRTHPRKRKHTSRRR